MAHGKTYRTKRQRRQKGKTDYRQRLELLKSGKKRLTARIKNNSIITQIIKYNPKGDETITQATSQELKKYGYEGHPSNTPAAYLTGLLIGKKAQKENIKEAVFDIGLHTPTKNSRVFAVLKGATQTGLNIPHNKKILPSDKRTNGKHIEENKDIELNIEEIAEKIKEGE